MRIDRTSLPGVDLEGFVTLERLSVLARRSLDDFVTAYPVPALVVEGSVQAVTGALEAALERERSFARTLQGGGEADIASPGEVARYVGRVVFLTKRPGNLFPEMITVGRVANADITLVVGSVSKVHGYFREEGGAWSYTDQRATNGTFVNSRRLAEGERVALANGDLLQFGADVVCTFQTPDGLARRFASLSG